MSGIAAQLDARSERSIVQPSLSDFHGRLFRLDRLLQLDYVALLTRDLVEHVLELILHFGLGRRDLLHSLAERVLHPVGLLSHVFRRVLDDVLDELAHLYGRHALVLGRHDVVVRVLCPRFGRRLTISRIYSNIIISVIKAR